MPGYWGAFFGGHLAPDEDYKHNATNELSEELGIEVNENDFIPDKVLSNCSLDVIAGSGNDHDAAIFSMM